MVNETEITIERASQLTGFSRHHLERLIKVGVLKTYQKDDTVLVDVASLEAYSAKRIEKLHKKVDAMESKDEESIVTGGVKYVTLNRAARLSGYTQDYISSIGKEGTIETKFFGERPYISIESLFAHRRAIHAQQAKWYEHQTRTQRTQVDERVPIHRVSIYKKDTAPLFPKLEKKQVVQEEVAPQSIAVAVVDKSPVSTPSPFRVQGKPLPEKNAIVVEKPQRTQAQERATIPITTRPVAPTGSRHGVRRARLILQGITVAALVTSLYTLFAFTLSVSQAQELPLIGKVLAKTAETIVYTQ